MLDQTNHLPESAGEILGDLTSLAAQLGGTEGLSRLPTATAFRATRVDSVPALESFLGAYTVNVLLPHELPAVRQAYRFAELGQARELIALDQHLQKVPALQPFARASSNVGRTQLRRLRPLRTERIVQRYLQAVETGDACAWHTLVFGLVLALYSLPLRQGLIHFGYQTLGGFVAGSTIRMRQDQRTQLMEARLGPVTAATERLIAGTEIHPG